jgi:hypothetical protein
MEPCKIKMVAKSREIDRTSRCRHSLRTGNELWTLDHILVLGKKGGGERKHVHTDGTVEPRQGRGRGPLKFLPSGRDIS